MRGERGGQWRRSIMEEQRIEEKIEEERGVGEGESRSQISARVERDALSDRVIPHYALPMPYHTLSSYTLCNTVLNLLNFTFHIFLAYL